MMVKKFDLGRGVLLFIPGDGPEQLLFQFGKPLETPPVEVEQPATIARLSEIEAGKCVRNGGFSNWLSSEMVPDDQARPVSTAALYRSYVDYAKESGVPERCVLLMTMFGRLLTLNGFVKGKDNRARIVRFGWRFVRDPVGEERGPYGEIGPYRCNKAIRRARVGGSYED